MKMKIYKNSLKVKNKTNEKNYKRKKIILWNKTNYMRNSFQDLGVFIQIFKIKKKLLF